ncbi:unnamed protein product, partial [Closterium sp. NIES-53]
TCGKLHTQHHYFSRFDDAWRAEFGDDVELPRWADLLRSRIAIFDLEFDAILSAMYTLSVSAEGDCYLCVPPDLGIAAAALGASEFGTLPGTAPAEALHTFTLDSGASRCFFRDSTTLTPLPCFDDLCPPVNSLPVADPGVSPVAPPSDESVELSGPYRELVGCLMYLMTCTRPDLAYPLSLLARYVAPATQRSSQGYTFSRGSSSLSLRSTRSSSVLSSKCEAEIYARAMAPQELRWLTYLLTDLGEQPRLPPLLYVDNKAMIALCQEHRLEHRTKHIALRYFLARELQLRGQLRLVTWPLGPTLLIYSQRHFRLVIISASLLF